MKFARSVIGFLLIAFGLILCAPLWWGVWLLDVVKPRAIVVDQLFTTNGDHLRLTQLWVGDGYATEFFHTDKNGQTWTLAIDGDAGKAWRGSLRETNRLFRIDVLNMQFFYDIQSHVVTDSEGRPQMVEVFPPGTPIIPPR